MMVLEKVARHVGLVVVIVGFYLFNICSKIIIPWDPEFKKRSIGVYY